MGVGRAPAPVRLAELVASLSLGIDLGFGQPMEHVLRQCLIALRLADLLDLDEQDRSAVYYTALLVNVACHSDAHEQSKWFGDDIALRSTKYDHELGSVQGALASMRRIGSGNPPLHRFRVLVEFALSGRRQLDGMIEGHSLLARALAEQLGLPEPVRDSVGAAYEQWDGKGWPGAMSGAEIPIAARLAQLGEFTEVAHRVGGAAAATGLAADRAGGQFDPRVARLLIDNADAVFRDLDEIRTWDAVIDAEPALAFTLTPAEYDAALTAIADFVDLKSPYLLGHSRAVAELVAEAARRAGCDPTDVELVRRAALVDDFGRLGVSNSIWDRKGPLGAGEWERVRLYPYLTERMLHQSPALAPLGAIAVQARERLDGSGYPRGLAGSSVSPLARLLGAADAYIAMREPRAHRAALTAEQAAVELRADVSAGRSDAAAVDAVLAAAGHRVPRRRTWPAGLTEREVEVLRLLARGLSNKEIAQELVIAAKTAGNHVEHIYTKTGASNRAGAGLFAVQHGLLPEEELRPFATVMPPQR